MDSDAEGDDESDEEQDMGMLLADVEDDPMPDVDPPADEAAEIDTLLSELDGQEVSIPAADPGDPPEPSTTTDTPSERTHPTNDPEEPPAVPRASAERLRRDRFSFYLGTILVSIGGIGLVLGSLLHDALRVPWFGTAFDAFGPLNATGAGIGFFVLLIGLIALWRGLRGGVIPTDAVEG